MSEETKTAPTTPTTSADDVVVVGGAVADEYGVLAEGAVAVQGDHALVVARFADTTSARAIYDSLLTSELDGSLHIDGVLVVKADGDGRLHVEKMTDHSTRTGLKWGIVGGVVAAVFLPATIVAGAVALGAAGAAAGKARNLRPSARCRVRTRGRHHPGHVRDHGPGHRDRRAGRRGEDARRPGSQDRAGRRRDRERDQGGRHAGRNRRPVRELTGRGHRPGQPDQSPDRRRSGLVAARSRSAACAGGYHHGRRGMAAGRPATGLARSS